MGDKEEDSIQGELSLHVERLISSNPREIQDIRLEIGDLYCRFLDMTVSNSYDENIIPMLMSANDISCEADMPGRDIALRLGELNTSLYPDGTNIRFPDIDISGYRGRVKGRGFIAFEGVLPRFFLEFDFNGLDMSELVNVIGLKYEVGGNLSGRGIFDSSAFSFMTGRAEVLNGYVRDVELLNLIADFLGVSSLKDIYFDDCSSNFIFSNRGEEIALDNIRLSGKDIYMDADLTLRGREKINGDMLVRLSKDILKESFKLRLLFMLMGERLPYVDFEFQIGGFLKNPHIKWLDTRFRDTIMRYLSERGQKAVETQIEQAIKPLLEDK